MGCREKHGTYESEGETFRMDPGTVVWLPGSGFTQEDYDAACGGGYYACGAEPYGDGVLVYCCPY